MIHFAEIQNGILFDAVENMFPSSMFGVTSELGRSEISSTHYGFVFEGEFQLRRKGFPTLTLVSGMHFCCPGAFQLDGQGRAVAIERKGYRGLFSVGGPVETRGRLSYIDGCTTSLLAQPARMGEPCLNLLCFPPQTVQTEHTHPTLRMGLVYSGSGLCLSKGKELCALKPGQTFFIEEGFSHSFHTQDQQLSIIAFHPDTDWGPTDQQHPMLNRTYMKQLP